MNGFWEGVVTIFLAIIGLGIVSVLVSNKANTVGVIRTTFSGFGNAMGVAQSPVTGTAVPLDLSYPTNQIGYGFGG